VWLEVEVASTDGVGDVIHEHSRSLSMTAAVSTGDGGVRCQRETEDVERDRGLGFEEGRVDGARTPSRHSPFACA
jgi:hypothetical protein